MKLPYKSTLEHLICISIHRLLLDDSKYAREEELLCDDSANVGHVANWAAACLSTCGTLSTRL